MGAPASRPDRGVSDHLRTSRYRMNMDDFLYQNPRLHLVEE